MFIVKYNHFLNVILQFHFKCGLYKCVSKPPIFQTHSLFECKQITCTFLERGGGDPRGHVESKQTPRTKTPYLGIEPTTFSLQSNSTNHCTLSYFLYVLFFIILFFFLL